ncbi:MAG: ATP-binding cassette domain-containing protein [Candidatus Riflebacteria bacterium]|nr:ATP-binding cassette domain-containing protein [Candidatus Riflebacteria bacterium]
MIEVTGLTKLYGDYVAISDISFGVKDGEIVGFLGPNGAGKTTTMKILTCCMPATEGTAKVDGFDIFNDPMEVKRRVGYLPETPPLYPELTVQDYLTFVAEIKEIPWRQRSGRVAECMRAARIDHVASRLIGHLSRGYQQRVGIAQALVHNPKVLILDEPTVGLDPNQIREVRELIKELGRDRTIILSTHILPEVSVTCERIIIVNQGRIVANGTEEELSMSLGGRGSYHVAVKAPRADLEQALGRLPGVVSTQFLSGVDGVHTFEVRCSEGKEVREDLFAVLAQRRWTLFELKPPGVSLEEVFARLTISDVEVA